MYIYIYIFIYICIYIYVFKHLIQGTKHMSFESFESHCATLLASGENIVFLAEGTGRGGTVRIKDFQVCMLVCMYVCE
jgi:hypothetical protein